MRVVIIGPGRIGCGYLCPLFRDAGWEVVLAARTQEKAERIRNEGGFAVQITGFAPRDVREIKAVAVDTPGFERSIAAADLVVTAVGVRRVEGLALPLARALAARDASRPLQIWVAENHDCAPGLERAVRVAAASGGHTLPPLAVAGAVAEVAVSRGNWDGNGRPLFLGDPVRRLRVDDSRLILPLPRLPAVEATRCYRARLQEKLFVFNAGHALCAYLGVLRGHASIHRAIGDHFLRPLVAGSMLEARRALATAYPELGDDVHLYVAKAFRRFEDAELADPIARVGREPLRKLGPEDRLIGAAQLIRRTLGRVPYHFALGIAGALLYRNPGDEEAPRLAEMLERTGVDRVLEQVCGLESGDELAEAVKRSYRGFILTENGAVFPPVYGAAAVEAV